jgi:MerR family transcriptional regulator, redox-sensitive transcriptional activator SoxR
MEGLLSIGDLASRVGLQPSALRFYEDAGLLPAPERVSGQRQYGPEAEQLLLFVRFCQRVGFSLAEIRELLASGNGRRAKQRWRDLVDSKLDEVDALIRQARAVRGLLKESRECDCVALDNCNFLRNERLMPRSSSRMASLVSGRIGRT